MIKQLTSAVANELAVIFYFLYVKLDNKKSGLA